ncbi:hypothetical protein M3Y97_00653600 [Aphelenchoides bicaudatus]|nr:hypothetical protein M3Y97_00653600 [Aphelenchoides bicaudatus]
MADQYTNPDGRFFTSGKTESISRIKPYIKLEHVCTHDSQLACVRFNVPDQFVTDGDVPRNCWDMGIIELADIMSESDC